MMTEILLIGCFLRHTIQSNLLCFNVSSPLKCVVLISFCPFLYCEIDALCHHFNKAFMYVCDIQCSPEKKEFFFTANIFSVQFAVWSTDIQYCTTVSKMSGMSTFFVFSLLSLVSDQN